MTLQIKVALFMGLGAIALLPGAKASERDQKTFFTFSGPVEIPGQVLPAGTYVFKLLDSPSHRHIVQVFSKDEKRVFSTFFAIPDYRQRPSEKSIITFTERPAGMPMAIKGWFYPGRIDGHEFVYPQREAVALAKANNTPVPSMPQELAANTTQPIVTMRESVFVAMIMAPLKAEEPNGEEVELAQAFPTSAPPQGELPDKLPSTATSLPLLAAIGLLSLATAAGVRIAAARGAN